MSGKPIDSDYHKKWRASHPEYRERQNSLRNERRRLKGRGDRSAEIARRKTRAIPKPPQLYPALNYGTKVSYLDDELRMDVAQERALAELEGRDPDVAARDYRAREKAWTRITMSINGNIV